MHRTRRLDDPDRSVREGIPVTALPRTLLDLAEVLPPQRLARAVEQADRLRLLDVNAIEALCERSHGRRGLSRLRILLDEVVEPSPTRSELERRFVELCRRAGLPPPALNVSVAGFEVDALFKRQRLVVELDGFAFHGHRGAFESDRVRDAELQLVGYRVVRITSHRIDTAPAAVASTVRALLAFSPPGPA